MFLYHTFNAIRVLEIISFHDAGYTSNILRILYIAYF